MLNFGGSDLRTDFLLKFGSSFYEEEEEEGEVWVTVIYIILLKFIKILMFVDVKWQKLECHVRWILLGLLWFSSLGEIREEKVEKWLMCLALWVKVRYRV